MSSQPQWGVRSVQALVRTRMQPAQAYANLTEAELHPWLAVRYLDLAVIVAARIFLSRMDQATIVLPDRYNPTHDIPQIHTTFADCQISTEFRAIYERLPAAVAIFAPISPEGVAVNERLHQDQHAPIYVKPPTVGDGFSAGFARSHFGDDAIERLADSWPPLV